MDQGIYLVLEPNYSSEDGCLRSFDISVYNNTRFDVETDIEISFENTEEEACQLKLASNDWLGFSELDLYQFNDVPHLNFKMQWSHLPRPTEKKLKPKAKHVSRPAEWIEQLEVKAYCLEIWKPEAKKVKIPIQEPKATKIDVELLREMMLDNCSSQEKIDIEKSNEAVDIHADKMGLSKVDISTGALDYQLAAFETALDRAIANGLHTFLVIHGRGSGILRSEVRRRLKENKYVRDFRPCNDDGATWVNI